MEPFKAKKLVVSEWGNHPREPEKPEAQTEIGRSRFIKALESVQSEIHRRQAAAISFGSYRKEGDGQNV